MAADLDADIYICGPGPFMDLVESTVQAQGVAPERIFIERFLVEQAEKTDALIDDEATGAADTTVPDEVTVTLGGKTVVVRYQPGDTLLETARRGGLRPPFSCEAGNCATCMAFLKEGSVRMRANNALDARGGGGGLGPHLPEPAVRPDGDRRVRSDVIWFRARARPGGRGRPHRSRAPAVAPSTRPGTTP